MQVAEDANGGRPGANGMPHSIRTNYSWRIATGANGMEQGDGICSGRQRAWPDMAEHRAHQLAGHSRKPRTPDGPRLL